jgi:hypothetical protein
MAELESGARWMIDSGLGLPHESGMPSVKLTLLMGQDLPEQLMGFGGSRTIGDEPGIHVTLHVGQQEISFWTSEDVGNRLSSFLASVATPQP